MKARWCRVSVLMGILFGGSQVLAAEPNIKGEVLEYGYYQSIADIARKKNPSSPTGFVRTGGQVQLVTQSADIPNIQGLLFGFKFRLSGYRKHIDQAWLRLVVTHPLIIRPNGSRAEGYSYPVSLPVKNGAIEDKSGYKLDNKFEMVEGEWTFQYWDDEKKLIEQKFNVRAPTKKDYNVILAAKKDIAKKIEQGVITVESESKPRRKPRLTMPGS